MTRGTPRHSIRIPDDFWAEVQAGCAEAGVSVSEVARGLLRGWLDGKRDTDKQGDGNE